MRLTLPMPPSANDYWKVWRGRAVTSDEARRYKQGVRLRALTAGRRKPLTGDVVVTLVVYRAQRKGDLDNRLKVLLDALCGVAFADDSQVAELHARRCEDPSNPRVEVRVEPVEGKP